MPRRRISTLSSIALAIALIAAGLPAHAGARAAAHAIVNNPIVE